MAGEFGIDIRVKWTVGQIACIMSDFSFGLENICHLMAKKVDKCP